MHSTAHWRELIQLHLNTLNDMYIVYNILSGHMNNTFEWHNIIFCQNIYIIQFWITHLDVKQHIWVDTWWNNVLKWCWKNDTVIFNDMRADIFCINQYYIHTHLSPLPYQCPPCLQLHPHPHPHPLLLLCQKELGQCRWVQVWSRTGEEKQHLSCNSLKTKQWMLYTI